MIKHTELPWEQGDGDIYSPNIGTVAKASDQMINVVDNAEFIVKACNMHYEMLEALILVNKDLNKHFGITDKDEAGNVTHEAVRKALT